MSAPVLRLSGVEKRFGPVRAVDGVDLALGRGKILALLGPSGCGKTTTLRLLAGFEAPDAGTIEIDGRTVAGTGSWAPPERRRVGMVFQDYALFPHLSVERNVAYGLRRGQDRTRRVAEVLRLTHLDGLGARMPHELSGGQQQRVALARALAPAPALILLDEPFSNLDASLRARVRAEMREILRDAGATAVFVTHDQEEALSLADEVAVMLRGRIAQCAAPEELYPRPASREVAAFVGDANFVPGRVECGVLHTALGPLPAPGLPDGDAEAMLRPEEVALTAAPDGDTVVIGREFYGHDQLIHVRLPSGFVLHSRLGAGPGHPPGQRVRVQAPDSAVVFPVECSIDSSLRKG